MKFVRLDHANGPQWPPFDVAEKPKLLGPGEVFLNPQKGQISRALLSMQLCSSLDPALRFPGFWPSVPSLFMLIGPQLLPTIPAFRSYYLLTQLWASTLGPASQAHSGYEDRESELRGAGCLIWAMSLQIHNTMLRGKDY